MIDTDKLKTRIKHLKSNLIHGACASIQRLGRCLLKYRKKEEPINEDFNAMCLDENGNPTLAKETDFTRGFVKGAQWQKRKDSASVSEELEEASKEWLIPQLDKSYANYGEGKMMELTHFDGYAMLDAIEFGAKWQREKDESTTEDLGEYINELSKQFTEVSFAKISRIAVRVAKWQKLKDMGITNNAKGVVTNILNSSDKSLDIYATEVAFIMLPANLTENYHMTNRGRISDAVRLGAKWKVENLWKPADGDDLPEIDREVVVFTQNFPDDAGIMSVSIAHRPDPNGWDGKSLRTGKVEHYTPKTYGKGGWNIPDIKWWLDVKLPKEIEL